MTANGETQRDAQDLSDRIIWVDCEMTGLDVDKNRLVEIACIVTDGHLNQVAELELCDPSATGGPGGNE
jgi:DNA polymerase III epsilon subunit-like protein